MSKDLTLHSMGSAREQELAAQTPHRVIDGVHFLRLRGSSPERAYAHAQRLRPQIHAGAILKLAQKNQQIIRRGPGVMQWRAVQDTVVWFYDRVLIPWLARKMQPETRAMIRALSRGSGVPFEDYRAGLLQPEGILMISSIAVIQHLMKDIPGGLPGCSSAVALKETTRAGRMLVARNQDYPIVGYWETSPVVQFHEPSEPGYQRHVSVSTAGVHVAGLTSINESGLTIASHSHFRKEFSFRGVPVIPIGEEIITRARTIGEAVDIARKYRRSVAWGFVVSSWRENDAVVIEMTPDRTEVRHADRGFLVHSNHAQSPAIRGTEASICGAYLEDLIGRVCRFEELLVEARGQITPARLAQMLGDHQDPRSGQLRVFGNTLSVIDTIKSVVIEPESRKLWVSSRPESPTGMGPYLEIDLDGFWSSEATALPQLPAHPGLPPQLIEAVRAYRKAYRAWHIDPAPGLDGPIEPTLAGIREAIAIYPQDANLWLQLGVVAFVGRKFEEALSAFESASQRVLSPHSQRVVDLYRARSLDVLGRREEALSLYRKHVHLTNEPKLRAAFVSGVRRRYRAWRAQGIVVDLQFADTLAY